MCIAASSNTSAIGIGACQFGHHGVVIAGIVRRRRIVQNRTRVDDEGRLQGLISIGDLNAYEAFSQEQSIYMLHEYLYGRV